MKTKELYKVNIWGADSFALMLPYEKEIIESEINKDDGERKILSVRLIDGSLVPAVSIRHIENAKNTELTVLIKELKEFFPKKLSCLITDRKGNIINSEYNMFGFSKISNHECLYNYLFGNKLYVYEKTVKVKAKVSAVIDAEIEVPAGCNILDYTDYIRKNSNFLKISDVDYKINDLNITV